MRCAERSGIGKAKKRAKLWALAWRFQREASTVNKGLPMTQQRHFRDEKLAFGLITEIVKLSKNQYGQID